MIWELLVEGSSKTRGVALTFCAEEGRFAMGPMCHPMDRFELYEPLIGSRALCCNSCKIIYNNEELLDSFLRSRMAHSWTIPSGWETISDAAWREHIVTEWVEYWTGIPRSNIEVDLRL